MINVEARATLARFLNDQHSEKDVLKVNNETGLELIGYEGSADIIGNSSDGVIHTLITLARHKDKDCWIAYMTGTLEEYTIAAVTHHADLGELFDDKPEVQSIIWIGKGDIPPKAEKALREYHASEVAGDYASQLAIMNFNLNDIIKYLPAKGRQAVANKITDLLRTNLQ